MTFTVAYARVSTDSDDQLNSLGNQLSFFNEYFIEQNYEKSDCGVLCRKNGDIEVLQGVFADEGISGKNLRKRQAFKQMMKEAKAGKFDLIVTKSVSRFGRNVEDTAKAVKDLKELGVGVFFLDLKINSLDNSKEFMINLFAALAQEESNNRSYITQFGVRKAQRQGKWTTGTPPYGYNIIEGFLAINEVESEIIKRIYHQYYHEGFGTGRICRMLNRDAIPTKKGKQWSQKQISTILDNKIYTGIQTTHTKQTIDINRQLQKLIPKEEQIVHKFEHLKIIEPELFKLVQIGRRDRKEKFGTVAFVEMKTVNDEGEIETTLKRQLHRSNTRYSTVHLFSNLLYCNHCGTGLKRKKRKAYVRKDGSSKKLGYEWCCAINDMYGKTRCAYRSAIPEVAMINFIKEKIEFEKKNHLKFETLLESYISLYYHEENIPERLLHLEKKIADKNEEIQTNLRLVSKGILSDDQFHTFNVQVKEQLLRLKKEHDRLNYLDVEIEQIKLRHQAFMKALIQIDTEEITNNILRRLISRIEVVTLTASEKNIRVLWNYMDVPFSQLLKDIFLKPFGGSSANIPEGYDTNTMDEKMKTEFNQALKMIAGERL